MVLGIMICTINQGILYAISILCWKLWIYILCWKLLYCTLVKLNKRLMKSYKTFVFSFNPSILWIDPMLCLFVWIFRGIFSKSRIFTIFWIWNYLIYADNGLTGIIFKVQALHTLVNKRWKRREYKNKTEKIFSPRCRAKNYDMLWQLKNEVENSIDEYHLKKFEMWQSWGHTNKQTKSGS